MSATANGVDPALVTRIVDRVKSQGIFDQFRRDCLGDVDTKPAYQNLRSRVEGYVSTFLAKFTWTPDMNKNHLRNSLRRQITESEMLASGVERIIEQVVDAQVQHIFLPRIEAVVKEYLHSDNKSSTSGDPKVAETFKAVDGSSVTPQPGSSGQSSSPVVPGVKGSPADSPHIAWGTSPLQTPVSQPKPPPLPGEILDHPLPPPLPETSSIQEQPKPPPLPKAKEASPPPLPPSIVPERRRTSSVSSTPSLDSVSSGPLSINSDDGQLSEKPKASEEKAQPVTTTPPAKATPAKAPPLKKRISIVKKVVVRKADGTKVVRVIRMDPTKATAKKLLMKAAARASGEQGSTPRGKTSSPSNVPVASVDESSKDSVGEQNPEKESISPADEIPSPEYTPTLGKRKHSSSTGSLKGILLDRAGHQTPTASEVDSPPPSKTALKEPGIFSRDETLSTQMSSDSEKTPWEEDLLSKHLEDVSSPGSALDDEDKTKDADKDDENKTKDADKDNENKTKDVDKDDDSRDFFPEDIPDHMSDSDSHVSDVTVSSVHTSDLSSFDDKISSSSSSSASSDESGGEDTDDYSAKKAAKPEAETKDSVPKSIAMLLASKTNPERSVSPASSGGKSSPRPGEARWKRQYMSDSEDEATKAERRKKAETKAWIAQHHSSHGAKAQKAEAKEERARRRQQMKEERDKEHGESPTEQEKRRQKQGKLEEEAGDNRLSKEQLKEQKLQEKRREAKRQRSLLSQSDASDAQQVPEVSPTDGELQSKVPVPLPPIFRQGIFCIERRKALVPFHYLLSFNLTQKQMLKKSQVRAKLLLSRSKEEKDGKKTYCRFSFQIATGKGKKTPRWREESSRRKQRLQDEEEEELLKTVPVATAMTDDSMASKAEQSTSPIPSEHAKSSSVADMETGILQEDAENLVGKAIGTDVGESSKLQEEAITDFPDTNEGAKIDSPAEADTGPVEEKPPCEEKKEILVESLSLPISDTGVDDDSKTVGEGIENSVAEETPSSEGSAAIVEKGPNGEETVPKDSASDIAQHQMTDVSEAKESLPTSPPSVCKVEPKDDASETDPHQTTNVLEAKELSPASPSSVLTELTAELATKPMDANTLKETGECEALESGDMKQSMEKEVEEEQSEGSKTILPKDETGAELGEHNETETQSLTTAEERTGIASVVELEREEISSDECEFEESDKTNLESHSAASRKPLPLSSIFQQTEAISSDEELVDITTPSQSSKKSRDQREEAPSEGEVEEDVLPLHEESITKVTEDISGDELSDDPAMANPPTPTMDEPTEFEGLKDERSDGQQAIPIVLVHSPKGGGRGSIRGVIHGSSSQSPSDADGQRRREGTPKPGEGEETSRLTRKNEEIEEGELDADMEEGEVPDEKDRKSLSQSGYRELGNQEAEEEEGDYGKKSRRRAYSPHPSKEDEYFHYGRMKRSRHQSPSPTQSVPSSDPDLEQAKPATRKRTRSGGALHKDMQGAGPSKEPEGGRVPSALMERRSSRFSRRVSPPRRYSPSESRVPPKVKSHRQSPPPAAPPSSARHETTPPPQPQQHRHFTRRMSGRDEERRSHRYEDMYYYDSKRSRTNPSPASATGKHTKRTSTEERKRKR
ncbi:uncharacterized protein [Diadema antillarum]|uniref:uncharacterized protein n=1 Tax=Diadema antillarum TaxID=105358 RepID=UPI003A841C29